jgi:hypothetical protein
MSSAAKNLKRSESSKDSEGPPSPQSKQNKAKKLRGDDEVGAGVGGSTLGAIDLASSSGESGDDREESDGANETDNAEEGNKGDYGSDDDSDRTEKAESEDDEPNHHDPEAIPNLFKGTLGIMDTTSKQVVADNLLRNVDDGNVRLQTSELGLLAWSLTNQEEFDHASLVARGGKPMQLEKFVAGAGAMNSEYKDLTDEEKAYVSAFFLVTKGYQKWIEEGFNEWGINDLYTWGAELFNAKTMLELIKQVSCPDVRCMVIQEGKFREALTGLSHGNFSLEKLPENVSNGIADIEQGINQKSKGAGGWKRCVYVSICVWLCVEETRTSKFKYAHLSHRSPYPSTPPPPQPTNKQVPLATCLLLTTLSLSITHSVPPAW